MLDLQVRAFRCIEAADLALDPRLTVITGRNGAGKTSLLEAAYFLGRGRSFRTADHRVLVQAGASGAQVTGRIRAPGGITPLGVGIGAGGLDIHVGGRPGAAMAELVTALPVQAIHAEIGELVQGPPETRRRLLDWGVFHVEHQFLDAWRRFRRALSQRNAILRDAGPDSLLEAWEGELAAAGETLDGQRRAYFAALLGPAVEIGSALVGHAISIRYQRGWAEGQSLQDALRDGRTGDRSAGYTRQGPQRADLQFEIEDARSRWRASKGQQKLLGAAVVLAQCHLIAARDGPGVLLLVDEPAADLDPERLGALLHMIGRTPAQVILAAITAEGLPLAGSGAMFHVEHGQAKALL